MAHRRRCLPFRQRLALAEHRSRTLLGILSRTFVCIRFSFESLVLPNPRLILRSVASS